MTFSQVYRLLIEYGFTDVYYILVFYRDNLNDALKRLFITDDYAVFFCIEAR